MSRTEVPSPPNDEERSYLLAAIENLTTDQRRTLWALAEHPRLIAAVELFLDELSEGLK